MHRTIPEDSTRVAELITGGVDMAVNIPPMEWSRVDDEPGVSIHRANSQRVMLIDIRHLEQYKTHDPRVREAIEYAIDNQALIDELLGGAATPSRTRVTPGNFGANPDLYDTYLFDPDHSRELLADAGYGPDNPCEIGFLATSGRYPMDRKVAQAIAGMLEDVGFVVDTEILEYASFAQIRSAEEQPEMTMIGLANSLWDAFLCFNSLRISQDRNLRYQYENEEFDELVGAASVEMDPDRRRQMYQRAAEMVAEDRPQIFLYQLKNNYGAADDLDWQPRADEMLWMWAARVR
ncbi:MAG: ABC transporter substrate-binding protein [Bacillota bacterium]